MMWAPLNFWGRLPGVPVVSSYAEIVRDVSANGDVAIIRTANGIVGAWYHDGSQRRIAGPIDLTVIPSGDPDDVFTSSLGGTGTSAFDGTGLIVNQGQCLLPIIDPVARDSVNMVVLLDCLNVSTTNDSRVTAGFTRSAISGGDPHGFGTQRVAGTWKQTVEYGAGPSFFSYTGTTGAPGNNVSIIRNNTRLSAGGANSATTQQCRCTSSPAPEQAPTSANGNYDPDGFFFRSHDAAGTPAQTIRVKRICYAAC